MLRQRLLRVSRRSKGVATGVALALIGAGVPGLAVAAQAATEATASLVATIVDSEAVGLVGRGFPAATAITFASTPVDLGTPETTSDASGRFAAASLLPDGFTGTIAITAIGGSVMASASVTVHSGVAGTPSAVASMSLAQDTPTTMMLTWTAPADEGSSPVTAYKIGWTEYGGQNRIWDSESPHFKLKQSPLTLINLTPDTTYTVRVTPFNTAGDGPTTTRTLATSGSGDPVDPPVAGGLPKKILAAYWQIWEGPQVAEMTANAPQYNLHYAAFAQSASGGKDGTVRFDPQAQRGDSLRADITASRKAGKKWLLSVGGGGDTIRLRSQANADEMVKTLIPIIDDYKFDGIDFDLECGKDCWNAASMKSVAVQLKAHYGQQFLISAAPRAYEDIYRDWAVQMGDALDLFGYQFYDAEEYNDPKFLRDHINYRVEQTVKLGVPASKIMIGAITYSKYDAGHNTVATYADIFTSLEKKYPDLRGAFVWDAYLDKKDGWTFASGMGRVVL
jgi:hypothetical protein